MIVPTPTTAIRPEAFCPDARYNAHPATTHIRSHAILQYRNFATFHLFGRCLFLCEDLCTKNSNSCTLYRKKLTQVEKTV